MNVGIVTAEIEPTNGWAQASFSLIEALKRRGVALTIVAAHGALDADYAILPRLVEAGEHNVILRQLAALPSVRRAFASCDLVHTIVEPFSPLGVLAAGKRPHVMTAHGTYAALPQMRRFPVGTLYRRAFERSACACVSRYTEEVLRRAAPAAQTHVIPNGVDAVRFATAAAAAEPYAKDGPVVLFVGAVKARKGAMELVRAMAQIRDAHPGASAVIAGSLKSEPRYVAEVEAEIDRLGLRETVKLLGHVSYDDLMRWYRTADVFCVPSMNDGWRFEGFGLVHLEAGVFGLPAIGTRECGAADAIDDGVTGLLVSQRSIAAELPQAILTLLGDPTLRRRMGAANREKAEHTSWDSAAAQYVALYEQALKAGR